jgi:hypothetical protein
MENDEKEKKASNAKRTKIVDGAGDTAQGGVEDEAEATSRVIMAGRLGGGREGEGDGGEESEENGEGLHIDCVAE